MTFAEILIALKTRSYLDRLLKCIIGARLTSAQLMLKKQNDMILTGMVQIYLNNACMHVTIIKKIFLRSYTKKSLLHL